MPKRIVAVTPGSPASKAGIAVGESLLSINAEPVTDVVDYQFLSAADALLVVTQTRNGQRRARHIAKQADESLGLSFEGALMDETRRCRNKCVFCFIDQMPRNLRPTLYVKDDDWRMSLVMGSYITLTNVSEAEFERILARHASPLYISVHAADSAVRVRMMGNPAAANLMPRLRRLAEAGIRFNGQIVLCPGYNDGVELDRTLEALFALYPAAQSVAVVPVGLTRFRDNLAPVAPVTREKAAEVVDQIEAFSRRAYRQTGARFVYASDEFYMRAGRPMPPYADYGDFPQIENGVGLCAQFAREFSDAVREFGPARCPSRTLVATGVSAEAFMRDIARGSGAEIVAVENQFFGASITVAGLVTGADLVGALAGRCENARVLIPRAMLRACEDVFLDGMTLESVRARLAVPVLPVDVDGWAFRDALCGV